MIKSQCICKAFEKDVNPSSVSSQTWDIVAVMMRLVRSWQFTTVWSLISNWLLETNKKQSICALKMQQKKALNLIKKYSLATHWSIKLLVYELSEMKVTIAGSIAKRVWGQGLLTTIKHFESYAQAFSRWWNI